MELRLVSVLQQVKNHLKRFTIYNCGFLAHFPLRYLYQIFLFSVIFQLDRRVFYVTGTLSSAEASTLQLTFFERRRCERVPFSVFGCSCCCCSGPCAWIEVRNPCRRECYWNICFYNRHSTRTRLQNYSATEIEGPALFENLNIKKNTLLFWKFDRFSQHEQSPQVSLKTKFFNALINDMTGTAILLENHCPTS